MTPEHYAAVAGFMHLLAHGCHRWATGIMDRLSFHREKEASRCGIHAAYGGVIVVQGDYGWPEEPSEPGMTA